MAEISASIVSYGGYEEVVQAAASILRYTSQPVDLYIIDNASPDGTGKKLERTRFEKPVTVICLVIFALNFLGEGLEEALNPKGRN